MPIRKGDEIAVTVTKEWAEAVGPVPLLHYFPGDETPTGRLFIARLVSLADPEGVWIESSDGLPSDKDYMADKMLVPWKFILAIRTSPCLQSKHEPPGFGNSE
jgi:hypothetical protein